MLKDLEIEQIKNVLKTGIGEGFLAGANLMIIKNGKELFYHEDGFADREKKIPIKRNSIFRLYSMTKPITATAAMILLERGEIDLYDPVSKYLVGFKNQKVMQGDMLVPAEREVILKDLLSMTSGLVYSGESLAGKSIENLFEEIKDELYHDSSMTTLEIANKIGECPLAFQPGTSWEYGTSADVLGAVVEIVSGKKFGDFLKDEIFKPLGMNDTDFWVPEEKRDRLVKTYEDNGRGLELYTQNHLAIMQMMDKKPTFESGGAGLVSTIDDYAKFANMLLCDGTYNGIQILKPKTVKYMTTSTLNSQQQSDMDLWDTLCGHSYGNLMRVMTDCTKAGVLGSDGEYGWDGWLGAYFSNSQTDNLTFLFMMQKTNSGTTSLTRKLRNIIFSACCE
ncbi:serine hydrolase domain-containing protein [Inconstantimicrobium mannanitabidum]|uniref:Serine hydrolase n=1 Tax=Inconstantimicrobium mannanitabidum TaxID=1604901 RepID=A0ACB5R890_9CLOT|nr:serine hydrolase domain-containing protein [Clostridium sp. TW13]GKX65176.1 serine hydrolase [Clostridium sp. TW13]